MGLRHAKFNEAKSKMTSPAKTDQKIEELRQQLLRLARTQQEQAIKVSETVQQLTRAADDELARRERDLERKELRIKQCQAKLEVERRYFEEDKQQFDVMRNCCVQTAFASQEFIILEVGGQHFETTPATLLSYPNCTLAYTFSRAAEFNPNRKVLRIDRNPKHFEKILDFMRLKEESLLWMQEPSLSSVELKEVKAEAVYYKLPHLVRMIGWELVKRKPQVTDLRDCGFKQTQTGKTQGFETLEEPPLWELNFSNFQFQSVLFKHRVSFQGSVLRDAVFKRCTFNEVIDLGEADIENVRFEDCRGLCEPRDTFVTINANGADFIPNHW